MMSIIGKCGGKIPLSSIGFSCSSLLTGHRMAPWFPTSSRIPSYNTKSTTFSTSIRVNKGNEDHPVSQTTSQWTTIYHLSIIRWAAAFNRLKVYQAVFTTISVPAVYALEQANQLPINSCLYFGAVGISGTLTLIISSLCVQNILGFIYLNESEGKLKFAYVDFWGRRKEAKIDINDMLIDWEPSSKWRILSQHFLLPIRLESDRKRKFKLLRRYGTIYDSLKYTSLFGED